MPFSSSQKLCRVGEREWATGHPMMPASRVRPVILMRCSSYWDSPAFPEKIEQLDQWQSENGEMVAANPRKQLHTLSFEAIGTDRAKQRLALRGNIRSEKIVAESPHLQLRYTDHMPQHLVAANRTGRRHQAMSPRAQSLKLLARLGQIPRLVEPYAVRLEDLVGADHHGRGMAPRNVARLLPSQRQGAD